MESKKYYTPEIEEFHVGFEYESLETWYNGEWDNIGTTEWIKRTVRDANQVYLNGEPRAIYHISIFNNGKPIENWSDKIRVKHLDRYDIEGCGFQYNDSFAHFTESKNTNVYNKTLKYRGDDAVLMLLHNTISNWVCIAWSSPSGACYQSEKMYDKLSVPIVSIHISNTIFAGTIKNKSELKVVLKQIINE